MRRGSIFPPDPPGFTAYKVHAMRILQTVLLMLGLLAVLAMGGLSASMTAHAETPPPCHETHNEPAPSDKAPAIVMACCIACVAPVIPAPSEAAMDEHESLHTPPPVSHLKGLRLAPEPGPPRA